MSDEMKKAKALLRDGDGGKDIDWLELIKTTRSVAKRSSIETDARLRNKKAPYGAFLYLRSDFIRSILSRIILLASSLL